LLHDARAVLHTLDSSEKPICGRDGRWFSVRIMPYRTVDDRVNGVVITFADITVAKTLEAKLLAKQAGLERRFTNEAPKRVRSKGRRAGID
jgi:two-component system CheB/CheR fusion protein